MLNLINIFINASNIKIRILENYSQRQSTCVDVKWVFEKNKNMYVVTKLCNDSINGHLNTPRHMEWPDQGVEIWSKTNKTTPFGWKGIAIST
jgi:hypothetical protein